ncbi:hypothetical protein PSAC2689_140128 [Paraburkholderia sacchari]
MVAVLPKCLDPVAATGCLMILSLLGEFGHGPGFLVAVGARATFAGARRRAGRGGVGLDGIGGVAR